MRLKPASLAPTDVTQKGAEMCEHGATVRNKLPLLYTLGSLLCIFGCGAALVVECIRLTISLSFTVIAGLGVAAIIIALILFVVSRQVFGS